MTEAERYFTPEEANAMLEDLRARLDRIREARQRVLRSATLVQEHAEGNGGGGEASGSIEALRALREDVEALTEQGIVLRDADTGLLDFPAQREGRLVYLCWRPDEAAVTHWHEVDSGFPGRKPL